MLWLSWKGYSGFNHIVVYFILLESHLLWFILKNYINNRNIDITKKFPLVKEFFKNKNLSDEKISNIFIKLSFFIFLFIISSVSFFKIIDIFLGNSLPIFFEKNINIFYTVFYIIIGFFGVFASRDLEEEKTSKKNKKEINYLYLWYKGLSYISFISAIIFFIYFLFNRLDESYFTVAADYIFYALYLYISIISVELCIKNIRMIFLILRKETEIKIDIGTVFFLEIFFSYEKITKSIVQTIKKESNIDLSESNIFKYTVKIFEPVFIIGIIFFWILTSIVIVPLDEQAIIKRFGEFIKDTSYKPGIYLKFPWPIDKVEYYKAYTIKEMNIGFVPDPHQKNMIWSKIHSKKNFNLVLGNGFEMISVDCKVIYKINDLCKYLKFSQNPEKFLNIASYRALTYETVNLTFDEVMVRNREEFLNSLKNRIQNFLDVNEVGIDVVEVVFLALHPPIEVVESYEDVISSQIDKKVRVLEAQTDKEYLLSMANSNAYNIINESKIYKEKKISKAIGQASSFLSRSHGYEFEPDIVRFRLKTEKMQKILSGKKLFLIDRSIMRKKDKFYLDLRSNNKVQSE